VKVSIRLAVGGRESRGDPGIPWWSGYRARSVAVCPAARPGNP